jgi:hypothetical protein
METNSNKKSISSIIDCLIYGALTWILDAGYWMLDAGYWILDTAIQQP